MAVSPWSWNRFKCPLGPIFYSSFHYSFHTSAFTGWTNHNQHSILKDDQEVLPGKALLEDILCHRHYALPAQESDTHFPSFYHSYHMDTRPVLASGPGGEANLGDSGNGLLSSRKRHNLPLDEAVWRDARPPSCDSDGTSQQGGWQRAQDFDFITEPSASKFLIMYSNKLLLLHLLFEFSIP